MNFGKIPRTMWSFIREFLQFLRQEKKWWLIPLFILILLVAALLLLTGGSALSPMMYTIL